MRLSELLRSAGVTAETRGDAEIAAVVSDSRQAKPSALFVCMPSANSDSHAFIPSAAAGGATAALVHSREGLDAAETAGVAGAFLSEYEDGLWRICRAFFGDPGQSMRLVGVTGTNGKTTTAWLLRDMMAALGARAGYLGTLGFHLPGEVRELSNTTPFPVELYTLLDEARRSGVEALAMEVSSHALEGRRADGIGFSAGVFTNLTQDHLDHHGTMEAYEDAKLRLFTDLPRLSEVPMIAALNLDDPTGARWARQIPLPRIEYQVGGESGYESQARLTAQVHEVRVDGIRLRLHLTGPSPGSTDEIVVPLGGTFNVQNCLAAAAGMIALGFRLDDVEQSLPKVRAVPGRFEAVPNEQGVAVIVDYAHTPDALEKLLDSVRALRPRRVVTVFGCGGDRDRTKRPRMARAASERSDLTVVTSDNPRTEDPQGILSEIQTGIAPGRESVSIVDRREAIGYAVKSASAGDVVVIAGKGHENYQIIGRTKHPMDDRDMARDALEAHG